VHLQKLRIRGPNKKCLIENNSLALLPKEAVVFREMNIMNSFTLECSFFGKEMNKDDSLNQKDPSSKLAAKKKKLVHMSV